MSDDLVVVMALRHLGAEREILVLKAAAGNFYAFPPYAKKPFGHVDSHMSWHESGERHAVSKYYDGTKWTESESTRYLSTVNLDPPSTLKGVGQIFQSGIFPGKFLDLFPVGTNAGLPVVLDTDDAGFRDDFIGVRAYLMAPGSQDEVPIFPGTGPRILHVIERTTSPWLAVYVFQPGAVC